MQVYSLHNPCRYVFVSTEGSVILLEFSGCAFLSEGRPAVDEIRDAISWYHFVSGPRVEEFATIWCAEIVDLMHSHGGGNRCLAIDRIDTLGAQLLRDNHIEMKLLWNDWNSSFDSD